MAKLGHLGRMTREGREKPLLDEREIEERKKKHIDGFYTAELGVLCRWLLFFFLHIGCFTQWLLFFCSMETFKIIIITIIMIILNYAYICAHECITFRDQKMVRDSPRAGVTGRCNR